jgi:hypothetical protein
VGGQLNRAELHDESGGGVSWGLDDGDRIERCFVTVAGEEWNRARARMAGLEDDDDYKYGPDRAMSLACVAGDLGLLETIRQECREWLTSRPVWPAVQAVGRALQQHRRLTGAEIEDVVGRADVRWQRPPGLVAPALTALPAAAAADDSPEEINRAALAAEEEIARIERDLRFGHVVASAGNNDVMQQRGLALLPPDVRPKAMQLMQLWG